MKKCLIICLVLFCISLPSYAQKTNAFIEDSLKHTEHVNQYVKMLGKKDSKGIITLSDFNFASNDTYVIFKKEGRIKARLISNKKLRKRMKNRNIRLTESQKKEFRELIEEKKFEFIAEDKECESILHHFYFLKFSTPYKDYIFNSKCLPSLKQNSIIAPILALIDR